MIVGKQFVLLCSLAISCLFSFASKEINKVSFQYFNSEQLTRLPEFFSGKEYTGNRIFCRSNSEREGLYFSFPLNQELLKLPSDSKITLSVIRSGQKEAEMFSFKLPDHDQRSGMEYLFLGLTGKDWPIEEAKPIAWQIEIKNLSDELLFRKKSFLWSHD